MKQILLRVNYCDWIKLRKIFPGERGESVSNYLRRYVKRLREDDKR